MVLSKTSSLLGNFRQLLSIKNANHFRQFATRVQRSNKVPRYIAIVAFGAASYYLFDKYRNSLGLIPKSELAHTEEVLNLDLNEIYEKTAVVFLSNPEVQYL